MGGNSRDRLRGGPVEGGGHMDWEGLPLHRREIGHSLLGEWGEGERTLRAAHACGWAQGKVARWAGDPEEGPLAQPRKGQREGGQTAASVKGNNTPPDARCLLSTCPTAFRIKPVFTPLWVALHTLEDSHAGKPGAHPGLPKPGLHPPPPAAPEWLPAITSGPSTPELRLHQAARRGLPAPGPSRGRGRGRGCRRPTAPFCLPARGCAFAECQLCK